MKNLIFLAINQKSYLIKKKFRGNLQLKRELQLRRLQLTRFDCIKGNGNLET